MTTDQSMSILETLNSGGLAVFATDTLYGIQAKAFDQKAVENLYSLRERDLDKPFIVLISSIEDLKLFDIQVSLKIKTFLENNWPNKLSIILPCDNEEFKYLHRGTKSLAFRLPNKKNLLDLLKQTGPLVSTSVNPQGLPPAKTIGEAKDYFGEKINLYSDEGTIDSPPSTIIKIDGEEIIVLRQGEVKVES